MIKKQVTISTTNVPIENTLTETMLTRDVRGRVGGGGNKGGIYEKKTFHCQCSCINRHSLVVGLSTKEGTYGRAGMVVSYLPLSKGEMGDMERRDKEKGVSR